MLDKIPSRIFYKDHRILGIYNKSNQLVGALELHTTKSFTELINFFLIEKYKDLNHQSILSRIFKHLGIDPRTIIIEDSSYLSRKNIDASIFK